MKKKTNRQVFEDLPSEAYFKSVEKAAKIFLLHIAQPMTATTLRSALSSAIKTYPSVKLVWVVFNNVLYQFDRKQILSGDFRIATKK